LGTWEGGLPSGKIIGGGGMPDTPPPPASGNRLSFPMEYRRVPPVPVSVRYGGAGHCPLKGKEGYPTSRDHGRGGPPSRKNNWWGVCRIPPLLKNGMYALLHARSAASANGRSDGPPHREAYPEMIRGVCPGRRGRGMPETSPHGGRGGQCDLKYRRRGGLADPPIADPLARVREADFHQIPI